MERREALGRLLTVAAAPLILSCRPDRFLSPSLATSSITDGSITLIGASDVHAIANPTARNRTAKQIRAVLDADPTAWAFNAGDLVWDGKTEELQNFYGPTWGQFKDRTLFALGNEDNNINPPGANFYAYTGAPKYYARTLGSWRLYVLNTESAVSGGADPQEQLAWLQQDVPLYSSDHHILAMCHYPLYNNPRSPDGLVMTRPSFIKPWWALLQQHGCEFWISGHAHIMERWKRRLANGTVSGDGIRQFVIGTGGASSRGITKQMPECEKVVVSRGVMRFDLHPDRYEWTFTDEWGVVRDNGVEACRKVLSA